MVKESIFDRPTIEFYESQAKHLEEEIARQMARAAQKNCLTLVVAIGENYTFLRIIKDADETLYLAEVIYAEELTLGQISQIPNPWELVIFAKPVLDQKSKVAQIANEIQSFLRSFYPLAADVQINLYDSVRSFRHKEPPIFQI